jgi:hypothetical protein
MYNYTSICIYIYELWNVHGKYSKFRSLKSSFPLKSQKLPTSNDVKEDLPNFQFRTLIFRV